ncbi:hypothetical protein VDG1235_3026 [Verrucomicrobiia bacterium DG1235]|nr:hypothetical protein VDG1235_3026 [Verrucomicrobiae bacterium DG1235]
MNPSKALLYYTFVSLSFLTVLAKPALSSTDIDQEKDRPTYYTPLHPSSLFITYKNEKFPVIGVKGSKVLIDDDGKQRALSTTRFEVSIERATRFADGYMELSEAKSKNLRYNTETTGGVRLAGGLQSGSAGKSYTVNYTADSDLKNAYIALILSANIIGPDRRLRVDEVVFVKELGDIKANTEESVKVELSRLHWRDLSMRSITPIFISDGKEVLTNNSNQPASYFYQQAHRNHKSMLENYFLTNESSDTNPVLYSSFDPIVSYPDRLEEYPDSVTAIVSIGENGKIESFEPQEKLSHFPMEDLNRDLKGWFFLPRLEKGNAIKSKAKVEIKFSK